MKAPHEDRGTPARDGHPPAAARPEPAGPEPAGDTAAEPVRAAPRLDRRSVQRLASGGAGNRAVAGLVAQRYASVVKPPPARAPGFAKTQKQVAAKKRHVETHRPAATESKSSQDAVVAPPDDKEAQGKAAQAEKMNAAKPGEFDKAAFVKAVNEAIAKQAPKNLDEADKFSDSDKADKVKGEVDGQVGQGKEQSAKDIETTTKAAPDTSKAKEKKVTPMAPDQAPANPGAPDPSGAVPDKQPAEVTDFSEEKKSTDQDMADAEVTEDQLKKGNEPQFDDAVTAKKEGEKHSSKAPAQARTAEEKERDAAKQGAAVAGTQAMEKLTATRQQAGKAVDGGKGETKSKDEQQRAQVTAKLQKVFDAAKKDVESTLSGLDKLVDDKFTAGEKEARDAFTADHKKRMKAYKDKRYSGWTGGLKWAKDKLLGMPAEANDIFTESRKLYVTKMQGVISDVADVIGVELGKAKDRIAQGRQELKAEVDKLPADLKKFGEEAAKDFAGKFDDLETQVDEKSQQLVTDLAQKYTDALNKIDEEIKKLQEENKGLWDKVKDAVAGAIKTILELKDMLLGVLAKAASAVMKIIKDPIGFLKNLVSAVGDGLKQFMQNIGSHLKKGLVSWLLGVSASAGIEIPAKFDLKGIIQLIASLLGLTWENLKSRIMRKGVPEEAMSAVETSVPVAAALAKEGPAGAVDEIAADVGDLKATLLEKISAFLIPTVLIAGITWVVSLFNPASAFIKAVKAIIDIVTFIVTQGAQIIEFVNTVLDAVIAIADGAGGGVPGLVENALAKSIPVLIGVLAALLGVGGLANKVKNAVQSLSKPVNRAIDKVIDKIAAAGKKLWNKLKKKFGKDKDGKDGKGRNGKDKDNKKNGKDDKKNGKDNKNKKDDKDKTADDRKAKELPKALAKAKAIMAKHQEKGSPVTTLLSDLGGLRRKYRWIKGFRQEGNKEAPFIKMLASEYDVGSYDDKTLEIIKKQLNEYGPGFVGKARKRWFDGQLSRPTVGSKRIWPDDSVLNDAAGEGEQHVKTDQAAYDVYDEFYRKGGKVPDKPKFEEHVFGKSSQFRRALLELMGNKALEAIHSEGEKNVKAAPGHKDTDVEGIGEIGYAATHAPGREYGAFHPFPETNDDVNEELMAAVNGARYSSPSGTERQGVIAFFILMVRDKSVGGISWGEFKEIWDTDKNSEEWIKARFRGAKTGKHEWIPTDYIMNVLESAVERRDKGDVDRAVEWVILHDALRSDTNRVIWQIIDKDNEVAPLGHVGAFYRAYTEKGETKYKQTLTNKSDKFHDDLRALYDQHKSGDAADFVDIFVAGEDGGVLKDMMWNGQTGNLPPAVLNEPIGVLYRLGRGEYEPDMTVLELAAMQQGNYAEILADFGRAKAAVRKG